MIKKKEISSRVIERLTKYLRYLENLPPENYISSEELANKMNFTAAQIRKDLSNFGEFGVRGKGYQVKDLSNDIEKILGVDKVNNVIVVGIGRLGEALVTEALVTESRLSKGNFNIIAMFDNDKNKIGKSIRGVKIIDIEEIESFLQKIGKIDIALLTVPKNVAQSIATKLNYVGIKAILNFVPISLEVPKTTVVENIDLYAKLQELNYWKGQIKE